MGKIVNFVLICNKGVGLKPRLGENEQLVKQCLVLEWENTANAYIELY